MNHDMLIRRIRLWLSLFMAGLVLSGLTAFPLESELSLLLTVFQHLGVRSDFGFIPWLRVVHDALSATNQKYPFLAYGTDWLAFAHLVIAMVFIGPFRDPVRNRWVIDFGLLACAAVIPLALVAGEVRGIPLYWRFLDCSFGIAGCVPLFLCGRYVIELERLTKRTSSESQEARCCRQ